MLARRRRWKVLNSSALKITSPVVQPYLKPLLGERLLDYYVSVAVAINIPGRHRMHGLGRLEGECDILAAREMNLDLETALTSWQARIHKNGSIRLLVAVKISYGQCGSKARCEVHAPQGAFEPILRTKARRRESEHRGENKAAGERLCFHA